MMFYTYILYSSKIQKFYTGQTEDLNRRVEEHNRGKTSSAAKGLPWVVVFWEAFGTRAGAVALEHKIKKRGAGRFLTERGIAVG